MLKCTFTFSWMLNKIKPLHLKKMVTFFNYYFYHYYSRELVLVHPSVTVSLDFLTNNSTG